MDDNAHQWELRTHLPMITSYPATVNPLISDATERDFQVNL